MKTVFLVLAFGIATKLVNAQLTATPVCPPFTVDVLAGSVNELVPKSAIVEIKTKFPCFSSIIEKDSVTVCAGVFYPDKFINFYTGRQYIEIGEKFKGKLTPALLGTARGNLFNTLGHPKLKDPAWDAYQMAYGTLILYYNAAGKINKIQMCARGTDAIKLCQ
ncbi:MAG: hypothetical protein JNM14_00695 [Ferruginibacter sp.]|nr:hypothetical protein [Ferruginibacter sp.]